MDIKLMTIQVAHNNNRTGVYGYDITYYQDEQSLLDNIKQDFKNGFGETIEFASVTYKLNDNSTGTMMLDTQLSGQDLVDSITQGFVS